MPTISKNAAGLTLINTFKVAPEKQQALIDLLDRATEIVMRKQPGFISANIHRSLDGTKVANYAQWRSKADFEAMQTNPEAGIHMKEAAALAEGFEPIYMRFQAFTAGKEKLPLSYYTSVLSAHSTHAGVWAAAVWLR